MDKVLATFIFCLSIIILAFIAHINDVFFYIIMISIGLIFIIFPDFYSNNMLMWFPIRWGESRWAFWWFHKPKIKKDSEFYTLNELFGERIGRIIIRIFGWFILIGLLLITYIENFA